MDRSIGSKYVLHEALGRGAMGQVFAGTVRGSGEPLAVKVLRPELISEPEAVARFIQERQILTSINHPHVVRVIDLVAEGETLAIVMELIQRPGPAPLSARPADPAASRGGRLAAQLLYRHRRRTRGRGHPPGYQAGEPAAGHLCRLACPETDRFRSGAAVPRRLPDQAQQPDRHPRVHGAGVGGERQCQHAADLYSAGIVLYEMLCGRTPFAGGHPLAILRRHVDQAPPPIPGIPAETVGPDRVAAGQGPGGTARIGGRRCRRARCAPAGSGPASGPAPDGGTRRWPARRGAAGHRRSGGQQRLTYDGLTGITPQRNCAQAPRSWRGAWFRERAPGRTAGNCGREVPASLSSGLRRAGGCSGGDLGPGSYPRALPAASFRRHIHHPGGDPPVVRLYPAAVPGRAAHRAALDARRRERLSANRDDNGQQ